MAYVREGGLVMERRLKLFADPRIAALDRGDVCTLSRESDLEEDEPGMRAARLDEAIICLLANMVDEKENRKK